MTQAKNRQHYIDCWESSINELQSVAYSSGMDLDKWYMMRIELQAMICEAAAKIYPFDVDLPAFLRVQAS